MHQKRLRLLLMAFMLSCGVIIQAAGTAESAQTINGKALGSVDDVVKEINRGDLSIPKKGLITLRGGDFQDNTYVDVYASVFGADASASNARKIFTTYPTSDPAVGKYEEKPMYQENPNSFFGLNQWQRDEKVRVPVYDGEPKFFRPAVSRKLYNGKRALMFHNIAPNGSLKYYFKTLSNTRSENSTESTPTGLVNMVGISDFGTYTSPAFSNAENLISEVYGTGVMSVKGYDREIFVAASGVNRVDIRSGYRSLWGPDSFYRNVYPKDEQDVRLEFFVINADDEGNLTQEALTALTQTTPFRDKPYIVSIAVGDFDGDKYNNEVALMIHARKEIRLFVYRLNFSDGKLSLRSMGDASGMQVYSSELWLKYLEEQPVADMAVGDFDGDGRDEIAVLYKRPWKATDLKNDKGWREGPMVGDVNCRVYSWNANRRYFDYAETAKDYHSERLKDAWYDDLPEAWASGVVGLRATAADLDGDGKSEIATILLGYVHHKKWDAKIKAYSLRWDDFYAYPHLAVWTFNRGSTKPIHDDSHVKGGGASGDNNYNYGILYSLAQDKNKKLLGDKPFLEWRYVWYNKLYTNENKNEGTSPDSVRYMYAPRTFSIAAGPFTGRLGTFRTVDDIAVAWRDTDGNDCVTIFKSKVNAAKQFDGFEDGKLAMKDKAASSSNGQMTFRGLVAVDLVGEGVELDKPVHLRKTENRSYIAALSAIPYHVDNVSADGSGLQEQPHNFTYSEYMNGGNMTVSYGKSTTDSTTNTVKQDLSQSVETMFVADPTGTDQSVQGTFGTVKGLVAFGSAIGEIVHGAQIDGMTPEQRRDAVWKPDSPTEGLTDLMDFLTDKVDSIDQRTNTEASTTVIEKEITATTHDAIMFTDTARHIWRYPVMTRPLPMWMAWGPRLDSTPIQPDTVQGEKELYITFTMSENSALRTLDSITDSQYQPLHEEGNFFSYPSQIADVEGYNDAGLLADENTWGFSNTLDDTGITFTKATSNMQHTEKKVTPSGFTSTVGFFDRLFNGDKATGIKMPDSENPKTFSKEFSKSERISYTLQGSSTLTAEHAADHTVKMQPFVAKEGAMTFGTAVELSSTNYAQLWAPSSIYQQKSDPALLLPQKFKKSGINFVANTHEQSATKIRGIRFYVPSFAYYSDNRLLNGMTYEIRVPLYNASFKDTGNFNVRLSWASDNTRTAVKTPIATVPMTLGGWQNDKNNNKGTAVFEWKPNLTPGKQYYFYVEIDPDNALDEVHEARYGADGSISDYGGNNTGFYPFTAYNTGDIRVSSSGVVSVKKAGNFRAAADEIQLTSLSFTDEVGSAITDIEAFINARSNDSFVPITANFNNSGEEVPYAFFVGYVLTPSGKQKLPNASINTIVDLNELESGDIDDVFMLEDIALHNGMNQVTFNVSPSELLASADEIAAVADYMTFGIITLTNEEVKAVSDDFYAGEDPAFTLEELASHLVSSGTSGTYVLSTDEPVFWNISSVKFSGTSLTSGDDDRDYLDLTLETLSTVSEDEGAPSNYGSIAIITVSSIAGYTPKGVYEITVHRSAYDDDDEWTNAGVLKFNTENAEDNGNNNGDSDGNNGDSNGNNGDSNGNNGGDASNKNPGSSGGGCNAGLSLGATFGLMGLFMAFRRKN